MKLITLTEAKAMTEEEEREELKKHIEILRDLGMSAGAAGAFVANIMALGYADISRPVVTEEELMGN